MSADDFQSPGEPALDDFGFPVEPARIGGALRPAPSGAQGAPRYLVCLAYLVCAFISVGMLVLYYSGNGRALTNDHLLVFVSGVIGVLPFVHFRAAVRKQDWSWGTVSRIIAVLLVLAFFVGIGELLGSLNSLA